MKDVVFKPKCALNRQNYETALKITLALLAGLSVLPSMRELYGSPLWAPQGSGQAQGLLVRAAAHAVPSTTNAITFDRDVAPIVYKNCAPCHRTGGSGPFPLLTYSDVKDHARQIVAVTRARYMPPWLPEPGYGDFAGERRLTDAEIGLIERWFEGGSPEGDPKDLPPAPRFTEGWQLGKPDLVLKAAPYTLPAHGDHGRDVFRNLIVPVPLSGPRYVKAIEFHPGAAHIFHHANILTDPTESARHLDGMDGQPGFSGMNLEIESDHFDPDSHFLFWKPGTPPAAESDGIAWRLDPGTDLILNLHMRPHGKPEVIQPEVGLYFTDQKPTRFPMLLQLESDRALKIPAGDKSFVVTDELRLPLDVQVLAIYPHAHYLGKDVQGYATLPDGSRKWLIWIKDWNFDWQGVFRYKKPVFLPKGTMLHMRWTYENSAGNPRNPNRPPKLVVGGNQATDEMGHLWLQVLPVNTSGLKFDPRLLLQEALSRHKIEHDPTDYTAHFNLGAALADMGHPDEAIEEYRRVLALRRDDAVARNSLGAALQAEGKTDEAIAEYRRVLSLRPGYLDASYNLGSSLLSEDNGAEAADQFRRVLKARPDDPQAHANLGRALALSGDMVEAASEFETAARLDPQSADVHYGLGRVYAAENDLDHATAEFQRALRLNPKLASAHSDLGTIFAMQGQFAEAVAEYQAALRIDPDLTTARANLERARAKLAGSN